MPTWMWKPKAQVPEAKLLDTGIEAAHVSFDGRLHSDGECPHSGSAGWQGWDA